MGALSPTCIALLENDFQSLITGLRGALSRPTVSGDPVSRRQLHKISWHQTYRVRGRLLAAAFGFFARSFLNASVASMGSRLLLASSALLFCPLCPANHNLLDSWLLLASSTNWTCPRCPSPILPLGSAGAAPVHVHLVFAVPLPCVLLLLLPHLREKLVRFAACTLYTVELRIGSSSERTALSRCTLSSPHSLAASGQRYHHSRHGVCPQAVPRSPSDAPGPDLKIPRKTSRHRLSEPILLTCSCADIHHTCCPTGAIGRRIFFPKKRSHGVFPSDSVRTTVAAACCTSISNGVG